MTEWGRRAYSESLGARPRGRWRVAAPPAVAGVPRRRRSHQLQHGVQLPLREASGADQGAQTPGAVPLPLEVSDQIQSRVGGHRQTRLEQRTERAAPGPAGRQVADLVAQPPEPLACAVGRCGVEAPSGGSPGPGGRPAAAAPERGRGGRAVRGAGGAWMELRRAAWSPAAGSTGSAAGSVGDRTRFRGGRRGRRRPRLRCETGSRLSRGGLRRRPRQPFRRVVRRGAAAAAGGYGGRTAAASRASTARWSSPRRPSGSLITPLTSPTS